MNAEIATAAALPATQPPTVEMEIPQEVFILFLNCLSREWVSSDVFHLALLSTAKRLLDSGMSEIEAANYVAALGYHVTAGRSRSVHNFMG